MAKGKKQSKSADALAGEALRGEMPGSEMLLKSYTPAVKAQLATAADLPAFLKRAGELSAEERLILVEQAQVLLEMTYVHLQMKRAMYAVDPVQRLKLLKYRLTECGDGQDMSEIEFHNEMTDIFNSLRDLHTNYLLPAPFNNAVAVLPFVIEEYRENGERRYIVSKVYEGYGTSTFQPGVEVIYWNGVPIRRAIEINASRQAGSNSAARLAQGLAMLTSRPMMRSLPPDEEWVVIGYRTESGEVYEHRQPWMVLSLQSGLAGMGAGLAMDATATAMAIDLQTEAINEARKLLYAPGAVMAAQRIANEEVSMAAPAMGLDTIMPTVFRARPVTTPHGTFGYIRIFTFSVSDADAFVDEFVRLVECLPPNGLIIDVRSNPGGLIYAAERLLQVLTPRVVEPERVEFVNSPLTLELCRRHAPSPLWSDFDLGPWVDSIALSVQTGAAYSRAFPITDPASCNRIGQRYFGPVVLITDALCYSSTDIFAAGFQDHAVGKVLGVHENTGAGGANVWTHDLLRQLIDGAGSPFRRLPGGAGMRVAIRRTIRVGDRAGTPVEDLGVEPDELHAMTRGDLINNNEDLINHAASLLAQTPPRSFSAVVQSVTARTATLSVSTEGLDRLDVYANGRPVTSKDIPAAAGTHSLRVPLPPKTGGPRVIEVRGFAGSALAAARRIIC